MLGNASLYNIQPESLYDEPSPDWLTSPTDIWTKPEPNPTKKGTLGDLLGGIFLSIMAAHILAHDKKARLDTVVKYEDQYKRCGRALVYDVECNGYLYRHYKTRIWRRKVADFTKVT